jgi:glyceraldehyde-3-phosphate dehydrogenase (NAD(P))
MLKSEDDALFHGCMMGSQAITALRVIASVRALTYAESDGSASIAKTNTALETEAA